MSTRDMGPGARHDLLDCQLSYWNWVKLVGLVASLRRRLEYWNWVKLVGLVASLQRRLERAEREGQVQAEAFETFSQQQRDLVPEWRQLVLDFEKDSTKKNPYDVTIKGLTEAQVRLQFAEEEAAEVAHGVPSLHDVSPSTFIVAGLDLEDEQHRVRVQAELKKAMTTEMQIDLKGMRARLDRSIVRFRKLQQTYMPTALQVLGDLALPATTLSEDVPILLPSALTPVQRERCVPGLSNIESLLRDAQCRSALIRLQNQLHIKS
ncbi:hypothetical protein FB451DRAFT_1395466 [Mycena latifolia]|nr:hypothetical protein FB451DRAFT_1395466 [Mycena latifolia]